MERGGGGGREGESHGTVEVSFPRRTDHNLHQDPL